MAIRAKWSLTWDVEPDRSPPPRSKQAETTSSDRTRPASPPPAGRSPTPPAKEDGDADLAVRFGVLRIDSPDAPPAARDDGKRGEQEKPVKPASHALPLLDPDERGIGGGSDAVENAPTPDGVRGKAAPVSRNDAPPSPTPLPNPPFEAVALLSGMRVPVRVQACSDNRSVWQVAYCAQGRWTFRWVRREAVEAVEAIPGFSRSFPGGGAAVGLRRD